MLESDYTRRTVEERSMPEWTDDGYETESKRTSLRMPHILLGLTKKEKEEEQEENAYS